MADLNKKQDNNLEYLSQKLEELDRGISVPESVKASQLLERMNNPPPQLKVVKTVKWQKAAGIAAAFVLVLGSVIYGNLYVNKQSDGFVASSQNTEMAMDAAPIEGVPEAGTAKAFAAPPSSLDEKNSQIEGMSGYFAKDYAQIREELKSIQDKPQIMQKKQPDEKVDDGESEKHPDTGGGEDLLTGGNDAGDIYTTNAQTQNVDEADIVKTDGKNLYYLYTPVPQNDDDQTQPIIKIIDAKSLETRSTIHFPQNTYATDMFLAGNKLAVMYAYDSFYTVPIYRVYDTGVEQKGTHSIEATTLSVYDVSDAEKPVNERKFEQQGNYINSRLVNDTVYLVTESYVPANAHLKEVTDEMLIPSVRDTAVSSNIQKLPASDICIPSQVTDRSYMMVSSISLTNPNSSSTKAVLGGGSTVYMSPNNLYIAGSITDDTTREETTSLLKFSIENGNIQLLAQGNVPGAIDGQFALDESSAGDLRIATTREYYVNPAAAQAELEKRRIKREQIQAERNAWFAAYDKAVEQGRGEEFKKETPKPWVHVEESPEVNADSKKSNPLQRTTSNNVYVLDESLQRIGTLEGLALDENIYSVRYIGDIAYIVTFKQVDPLFAIDLSNPNAPKVLGQLKIPGFSEYLHPIGSDTLLGFGYDTVTNSDGGTTTTGLKLSLFDISNPMNLKETQVYRMGGADSSSEAINNHKAFMYYADKNLIGVPVRLFKQEKQDTKFTFDGFYLFEVTSEKIEYLGSVSHSEGIKDVGTIYNQGLDVQRGVYIGDTVYTFSRSKVTAHSLTTLDKIAECALQ